jgi:hypothetical protein
MFRSITLLLVAVTTVSCNEIQRAANGTKSDDQQFHNDVQTLSVLLAAKMRDAIVTRQQEQQLMRYTFDNISIELIGAVEFYEQRRHQYDTSVDTVSVSGAGVVKNRTTRQTLIYRQSIDYLCDQPQHLLQNPDALKNGCIPLLIQQNVDGSNFFNRSWNEYKTGFSGSNGNYWLGNELLHQLTKDGRYKLRFDLQSKTNGGWYWAEYNTFVIFSESTNYELHVAGYTGNAGYDALIYSDRMNFTTYERDNDPWTHPSYANNCAVYNGGGFWYKGCAYVNVNNMAGKGDDFRWNNLSGGSALAASRMWLMCRR